MVFLLRYSIGLAPLMALVKGVKTKEATCQICGSSVWTRTRSLRLNRKRPSRIINDLESLHAL